MDYDFDKYLEDYISLSVRMGVNIQEGQKLLVSCPTHLGEIARLITREAFAAGAGDVFVRWMDEGVTRERYLHGPNEIFDNFPQWSKVMLEGLAKDGAAFLNVISPDPEAYKGVAPDRIIRSQQAANKKVKEYRRRLMSNYNRWSIMAVPSEKWAKKVFSGERSVKKAMDKLWEAIFIASRVDGSAVENWKKHTASLHKRVKKLNGYNFTALQYKNSLGTDLTVELCEDHIWVGGGDVDKGGLFFLPNIPTEEIFTAPKRTGVNGVVYSTKPLVYMGDIIDEFSVEFKDGRAVKTSAKKNGNLLEELIKSSKNADYLGEVALVPYNSPISQSGTLFYNTLYDENASCHFAFGKAYPDTVKGTEGKKDPELNKIGVNCSMTHEDFMIGSEDMDITGITKDGKTIPVFVKGNFAF